MDKQRCTNLNATDGMQPRPTHTQTIIPPWRRLVAGLVHLAYLAHWLRQIEDLKLRGAANVLAVFELAAVPVGGFVDQEC